MNKLGNETEFSYAKMRNLIIESEEVEKRPHKKACNTDLLKKKEFKL